ncbi:MAG: hypothetical protein L6264_06535 [Weeksellaceae bacterium]|nr:hypothetical protein [Bacteroidota bacterium]MCG2780587.1 hypothetical protein [Weeksellaceae bacterium]
MKKSQFSNQTVYWTIIAIIGGLMLWNLFATVTSGNLLGLLPVTIQAVLLWLITTQNQYAKIGIKAWIIIFLVIANGLQFFGRLLQDAVESFVNADLLHYVTTGFIVLLGITIFIYVNKTVTVIDIKK